MARIKMLACMITVLILSACVCDNKRNHSHLDAVNLPQFSGTDDMIAFRTHKWAVDNLTYVADSLGGRPDYWQPTSDTYETLSGDCEDGALLIAHILIDNGVPKDKVKVVGGYVLDSLGRAFGHAYCIYKRSDGEWITLDWCAYPDDYMPLKTRMPLRFKEYYGKIKFYLIGE